LRPSPPTAADDPASAGRDLLRALAAGTAASVGEAFLGSLVRQVAAALGAEIAFVSELLREPESPGRARVLTSSDSGLELPEGWEHAVADTPCELVGENEVVSIVDRLGERYPLDDYAARHGLEGYLAIAMRGSNGALLGYLGVMSRRTLEPDEDQIAALEIFAARAAAELERRAGEAALRAREAEVEASRSRIVQTADDERRRIGRDLHDGVQQRLVALRLLLDLASRKLGAAEAEAAALVEQAREEAQLAGDELRELARGLHPAGLAERGLGAALAAVAERSALPVILADVPDRRLPDPVEVTIYYLVSEALTNAVKHAAAGELRVSVRQIAGAVVAEVSDDGIGGADATVGGGLSGLRDRVEALGGTLAVESPTGRGTRLMATIPLSPWRTAREPFLEFGFEGDDGLGERLIRQVMDGRKTAAVSLAREWELEGGPPRIGQLLPVRDHTGRRWTAVEVVRVTVVPFSEIGADVVDAESAGTRTLEEWRAQQQLVYDGCREETALLLGEEGWRLTDREPMVIVWFRRAEQPAAAGARSARTGT
jgi:signal transduction histidine kinase/uncharacterized protein YhfF